MDITDYLHIKAYCDCEFRFQDLYPYDSFILGINNIYYKTSDGLYHIDSSSLRTKNKNVREGSCYIFIENAGDKSRFVEFKEAYYKDGLAHLIMRDIISKCIRLARCRVPENDCNKANWKIFDVGYLKNADRVDDNKDENRKPEILEFDY